MDYVNLEVSHIPSPFLFVNSLSLSFPIYDFLDLYFVILHSPSFPHSICNVEARPAMGIKLKFRRGITSHFLQIILDKRPTCQ
jgi:hypothetical protein